MRGSVFLMLFFVIIFYFNSRLYMRGSISAAQHLACSIHFNSRLYMRGSLIESHFCSVCQFQFTPLHERQRLLSAFRSSLRYFNSRLYMRGSRVCRNAHDADFNFNSRLYMRGSGKPMRLTKR